jgi:hypothetical protein
MADIELTLSRPYAFAGDIWIDGIKRPNGVIYSELLVSGFLKEGVNLFYPQEVDAGLAVVRPTTYRARKMDYESTEAAGMAIEKATVARTLHQTIRSFSNVDNSDTNKMGAFSQAQLKAMISRAEPHKYRGLQNQISDALLASIHAVDLKTEEGIYDKIFDSHWIKKDYDGISSSEGNPTDFATDTGRAAVAQTTILKTNRTATEGKALLAEIRKAAMGTSIDKNMFYAQDAIYMILPMSAGLAYYEAFDAMKDVKLTRVGLEMIDGTFTPFNSFTCGGIMFVCLPDAWFNEVTSASKNYRALILPRSSMLYSIPEPSLDSQVPKGFSEADDNILSYLKATGDLLKAAPSVEGIRMWQEMNLRGQDPILRRDLVTSGMLMFNRNTMGALFEQVGTTTVNRESRATKFEHFRHTGALRRMPQYIQEFTIDTATTLPATLSEQTDQPGAINPETVVGVTTKKTNY